jgi:hypothetical protein
MDKGSGHWGGQVEVGLPVLVVVSPVVEILMFFWLGRFSSSLCLASDSPKV